MRPSWGVGSGWFDFDSDLDLSYKTVSTDTMHGDVAQSLTRYG